MQKNNNIGAKPWVDIDDAPILDRAYFESADLYNGATLIRRGRPRLEAPKKMLSMRLDQDVIHQLRATGPGWQKRANDILKEALNRK
jgi:uncharacterized protein (DUF4415 family)